MRKKLIVLKLEDKVQVAQRLRELMEVHCVSWDVNRNESAWSTESKLLPEYACQKCTDNQNHRFALNQQRHAEHSLLSVHTQ